MMSREFELIDNPHLMAQGLMQSKGTFNIGTTPIRSVDLVDAQTRSFADIVG
jgi:hypothetical protein